MESSRSNNLYCKAPCITCQSITDAWNWLCSNTAMGASSLQLDGSDETNSFYGIFLLQSQSLARPINCLCSNTAMGTSSLYPARSNIIRLYGTSLRSSGCFAAYCNYIRSNTAMGKS